jgi:hypothetical protein
LLYIIIGFTIAGELHNIDGTLLMLIYLYCTFPLGVGYTLPLVIGRQNAYCNHKDLLSMREDPSIICKIQGRQLL